MKNVYKICWVITVLLSQACQHGAKTPAKRFDKNSGFYAEIPLEVNGEPDHKYRYVIKEDSQFLGLDSLEYGYDSVQLRVWLGHSLVPKAVPKH